ncbi:hypothetical protein CLOM_g14630, partial [Closterium sp. NIES-68]
LKSKGEVAAAVLKEWMPRAQRECGHKVKVIRSDNGGEFIGADFEGEHKYGPEGELTRYKSRLVARGFQQTKGKDYDEVFAPVGKGTTLRVLLAIAALLGWKIRQMDIVTAFLNGIILEEVRRLLDKEVRLEVVKTHQQAADIFTKRLAEADHWKGMKLAGMSVH